MKPPSGYVGIVAIPVVIAAMQVSTLQLQLQLQLTLIATTGLPKWLGLYKTAVIMVEVILDRCDYGWTAANRLRLGAGVGCLYEARNALLRAETAAWL